MREILFRGKTVVGSMWIRGSLLVDERNNSYIGIFLHPEDTSHSITYSRTNGKTLNRFVGIGFAMVNPETVGQWTGFVDKNGVQIFEGDFVKTEFGRLCILEWFESRVMRCWDLVPINTRENLLYAPPSSNNVFDPACLEVIGNIHDNPELLEE
jgi:hypothetical protein